MLQDPVTLASPTLKRLLEEAWKNDGLFLAAGDIEQVCAEVMGYSKVRKARSKDCALFSQLCRKVSPTKGCNCFGYGEAHSFACMCAGHCIKIQKCIK